MKFIGASTLLLASTAIAFQSPRTSQTTQYRLLHTRLQAVELPKQLAPAPTTFLKCVEQAVVCVKKAMENGDKLMEVSSHTQHIDEHALSDIPSLSP